MNINRIKTFHLLGLSHLPTNKEYSLSCAYTQKVLKLGAMLKSLGHKVYFYGVESSTVECDEFIQCSSLDMFERSFGKRTDQNKFYDLSADKETISYFNNNAIKEINKRKTPTDFLLCMYGWGHKKIAEGVNLEFTIEPGIGYTDTFSKYRVFESYNWMSYVYGLQKQLDGRNYDYVIPNYFDPNDFEYCEEKEDYILFLGRIIQRKGIEIAMQIAKEVEKELVVAGQYCNESINLDRDYVRYVGYADVEKRKLLLSYAKALMVPTQYIGPFEGVHIEAAFSGTPVITSDWGCFGETIIPGITGYRCRTLDDYLFALNNIDLIKSENCYNYAMNNYTMERLKWRYEEFFEMLLDLTDKGWYQRHPERSSIDCLTLSYMKE